MFIRYVFKNTTDTVINNFYAGQFWDFDIDETSYDDDIVAYDNVNNFGYALDNDGNPVTTHIGLALLFSDKYNFFAMDAEGTNDSIISWDGFSDSEKWKALSSGLSFTSAGPSDISVMISGGPFSLEPNKKFEVDFLIAAGDNLFDLTNSILRAKNKYNELPTGIKEENIIISKFNLEQNYPNPFNPSTTIKYSIPNIEAKDFVSVQLKVYDILGREVITLVNEKQRSGNYKVIWNGQKNSSGVYFYRLKFGNQVKIRKMLLLK